MSEEKTAAVSPSHSTEVIGAGEGLAVGTAVGNYVVMTPIAAGGCGTVYRARHAVLGRPVAIKVLHKELSGAHPMARRFLIEAMAVNMIRHPSIVDIFDVGELPDGRPYYVMEFLEGIDLDTHLKRHGRMSATEALALLEPVCGALEAAHHAGFVHRDIKASNIHLGQDAAGHSIIKLLDFGVAKALHPEAIGGGLTQAGSRIGTSSTMAPEQIVGTDISPQTDVYALGALLFRLLVGRNPFVADGPQEMDQMHLKAPPPRASQFAPVSSSVDEVVIRAMAKSPRQRQPTAAAFLADLRAAVSTAQPAALPESDAVGVYIEARVSADAPDPDDQFQRATDALEPVEGLLTAGGMAITLRSGTSLMGVQLLGDQPSQIMARSLDTAEKAQATLLAALGADAPIELIVAVHTAPIVAGQGGALDESASGPLMSLGDWVPASVSAPVYVSEQARTRG